MSFGTLIRSKMLNDTGTFHLRAQGFSSNQLRLKYPMLMANKDSKSDIFLTIMADSWFVQYIFYEVRKRSLQHDLLLLHAYDPLRDTLSSLFWPHVWALSLLTITLKLEKKPLSINMLNIFALADYGPSFHALTTEIKLEPFPGQQIPFALKLNEMTASFKWQFN